MDGINKFSSNITAETDGATKYPAKAPEEKKAPAASDIKNVSAADDTDIKEITISEEEEVDNVVELSKPYRFEGEIIREIDLSKIEDLSGKDAKQIERLYKKAAKGNISVQPELTNEYAMAAASFITGLPIELFEQLSLKDIAKIRNRVINFIYGE